MAKCDAFAEAVEDACAAPGTRQALRRALGKPPEEVPARTHAALMRPGLLPYGVRGADRRAYYTVAALIAARPRAERATASEPDDETRPSTAEEPSTRGTQNVSAADPPASSHRENLGQTLGRAVAREGQAIKANGAESRLHLMVRQDSDGLHRILPGLLRLLGSAAVPVDYGRLLNDLLRWDRWQEDVVVEWLESYYRTVLRANRPKA